MRRTVMIVGFLAAGVGWLWFQGTTRDSALPALGPATPASSAPSELDPAPNPLELEAPARLESSSTLESSGRTGLAEAPTPEVSAEEATGPACLLKVVDDLGQAVPEVRIEIRAGRTEQPARFSDAEGRCEFPLPRPGDNLWIRLERQGYFPSQGLFTKRTEMELTLCRSRRLRGRVLEAGTGRAVPGASVLLKSCRKHSEETVVTATQQGEFEFASAPIGGEIFLVVDAEGYGQGVDRFTPSDALESTHDVELQPAAKVRGRLVDAITGREIQEATFWPSGPEVLGHGLIADHLAPNAQGEVSATLSAYGYLMVIGRLKAEAFNEVRLIPGGSVEGDVSDPEGRPLEGVLVRASGRRGRSNRDTPTAKLKAELAEEGWQSHANFIAQAKTDAAGRFRIGGLDPDLPLELSIREEGWRPLRESAGTFEGPGDSIIRNLTLEVLPPVPTVTWSGRLLLNGVPVEGDLTWKQGDRQGYGHAEVGGRFRLERVPEGEVEFRVTRISTREYRQFLKRDTPPRVVLIGQGPDFYQDVEYDRSVTRIGGVVQSKPAGDPLAGISVYASGLESRSQGFARSAEDGTFQIEIADAADDHFQVRASRGGGMVKLDGVSAGTLDLVLELPETAKLRVRVAEDQGGILDHWLLALSPSGEDSFSRRTESNRPRLDEAGWHELEVAVGNWDALIRPVLGGPVETRAITVLANQVQSMDVRLEPTVDVDFELSGSEEGLPAQVHLIPAGSQSESQAVRMFRPAKFYSGTEAEARSRSLWFDRGRARIERLVPGRWDLVSSAPGWKIEPPQIEISLEGDQPPIALTIERP